MMVGRALIGVTDTIEHRLVERSAEARLVLLGAATREHVLLVGPPGVGKSLLCRRLGALFSENDSYFEVALTRFTTPDDVFGPLSLKALREDVSQRAADGFAGGAEVVFLDEIFRARALLPALLQLLNERTWPDGSRNRPAKLVSAVAANAGSNAGSTFVHVLASMRTRERERRRVEKHKRF